MHLDNISHSISVWHSHRGGRPNGSRWPFATGQTKGPTPLLLQTPSGANNYFQEPMTFTPKKQNLCKLVQVTERGWCFRRGRPKWVSEKKKKKKTRWRWCCSDLCKATGTYPLVTDSYWTAKSAGRILREEWFNESARVQTVMNHRFRLCIPKEVLAQESNKNNCLPSKPRLCPFLSRRFEGVSEESPTISDSFL